MAKRKGLLLEPIFWDIYATSYDVVNQLEPYKKMISDLSKVVLEVSTDKDKILIVGCGTGNLEIKLVSNGLRSKITSIDISRSMLKRAKDKDISNKQINWLQQDIERWVPDDVFDIVIFSNVAYTISNVSMSKIIDKLSRRNKQKKFTLIISDPLSSTSSFDYFKRHIEWKGTQHRTRRFLSILFKPHFFLPLLFVALVNVIIDWRGRGNGYVFRTHDQWRVLLKGNQRYALTCGGLNHLITVVYDH